MKTRFRVKATDTDKIKEISRKLAEESAEFYGEQPEALIEQYTQSLATLAANLNDVGDEYIYAVMEGHRGGWSATKINEQPSSAMVNGVNGMVEYGYEDNGADLDPSSLAKSLDIPEKLADHMLTALQKD